MGRDRNVDDMLAERVRHALATDPSVSEQGIHVLVQGDVVTLRGSLTSRDRCAAAVRVTTAECPWHTVRDELTLDTVQAPRPIPESAPDPAAG